MNWINKYKPKDFESLYGNKDIKKAIKYSTRRDKNGDVIAFYNYIFSGSSGIGKTSLALLCAKELFDNNKSNYKLINCSENSKIDVLQEILENFCKMNNSNSKYEEKLIILDEADTLSDDAQSYIKDLIDKFQKNIRFIFTCNYIEKMNKPLINRNIHVKFKKPSEKEILKYLENITQKENIEYQKNGLLLIIFLSKHDIRKCNNYIHLVYNNKGNINENSVSEILNIPKFKELKDFITNLIENKKNDKDKINYFYQFVEKNSYRIEYIFDYLYDHKYFNFSKIDTIETISLSLSSYQADKKLYGSIIYCLK